MDEVAKYVQGSEPLYALLFRSIFLMDSHGESHVFF